jgi:hypothetical protein
MMTGPVVDTPSALEFQREIMGRASEAELEGIAADLGRKSAALQDLLSDGASPRDGADLRRALRWVFATRRRADQVLGLIGPQPLAVAVAELLDEHDPVAERVDRFDAALEACHALPTLAGAVFDLPGELLHFTAPERYWLWTRWIWDPRARTGALALVTTDDVDLSEGASRGEVYLTVGRAMAFVDETGKAARFITAGASPFGADVFLAAVYGVTMYTVLRLQMTRELNRVVPPLPDLVRRLLGVYHLDG